MNNGIEYIANRYRGLGCNGKFQRDEFKCRTHCKRAGYKSGFCDEATRYLDCICSPSFVPETRTINFGPVFANMKR